MESIYVHKRMIYIVLIEIHLGEGALVQDSWHCVLFLTKYAIWIANQTKRPLYNYFGDNIFLVIIVYENYWNVL